MIEGLNLKSDIPFTSGAMRKSADSLVSSDEDEKLQFLLFVLDSLEARKLQVDSAFYYQYWSWALKPEVCKSG